MANRIPCYFLAPTWDLPPPPSGPLRLSSVLSSVTKSPERPLYSAQPPSSNDVFSSEQHQFLFSTDKLRAGKFQIFTRFLSLVVNLGADIAVGWESMYVSLSHLTSSCLVPFFSPLFVLGELTSEKVTPPASHSTVLRRFSFIPSLNTSKGVSKPSLFGASLTSRGTESWFTSSLVSKLLGC